MPSSIPTVLTLSSWPRTGWTSTPSPARWDSGESPLAGEAGVAAMDCHRPHHREFPGPRPALAVLLRDRASVRTVGEAHQGSAPAPAGRGQERVDGTS